MNNLSSKKSYHVGLIKGSGACQFNRNGHAKKTVVVQLRRKVDCLSCELWQYLGERIITRDEMKTKKSELLIWINKEFNKNFTRIIID